jgi:hypothetical protein
LQQVFDAVSMSAQLEPLVELSVMRQQYTTISWMNNPC